MTSTVSIQGIDLNSNVKINRPPADRGPVSSEKPQIRLERESSSTKILVLLSLLLINFETIKQLCSYGMKYNNGDRWPVPSTFLVFTTEAIKLSVFFVKMFLSQSLCASQISFSYLVPSTLYALNNNIYFLAMNFTSPPIWNILMQSRVICTALVYRFFFKKAITVVQWLGLLILTLAIIILQFSGSEGLLADGSLSWNILAAFGLAIIASCFSAVGPVYTEYLFKYDKRSFDDKQFQVYMFGTLVTGMFFLMERYSQGNEASPLVVMSGDVPFLASLMSVWVFSAVVGGIVVAVVIKKLDNIVKLYTQAVSNAVTAFACVVLFPRAFQFDVMYIASFLLTITAIYLYEVKTLTCFGQTVGDT